MTNLIVTCATIVWLAATGAVTHYDVYVDGTFFATVPEASIQMCRDGYDYPHDIYVVALDAEENVGPQSDPLQIQWKWNHDYDDDGVVGMLDFGKFAFSYGKDVPEHDVNGDGIVGWADFGSFSAAFSTCNNGTYEVSCDGFVKRPVVTQADPDPEPDGGGETNPNVLCDNFNRAGPGLGSDWEMSSDYTLTSDQLAETSLIRYHDSQVLWVEDTVDEDQFGRLQITNRDDNSHGFIFRSTPNEGQAGPHYEVHVAGTGVRWEYVNNASFVDRPDTCTLSSSVDNGDWFGAVITGLGNDTVVKVYVSSTELDSNPDNWPAPVCTLTGDPATPIDTGNRVGVRSYTSSRTNTTFVDNVCVGG